MVTNPGLPALGAPGLAVRGARKRSWADWRGVGGARREISEAQGRELSNAGDAMMVVFVAGAADAVACGIPGPRSERPRNQARGRSCVQS